MLSRFRHEVWLRLRPFTDLTVWVLILICVIPLLIIDPFMLKTLVDWTAYGLALAGLTVFLSLMMLADVDLSDFVQRARDGNVAAAIVVASVAAFMAITFLALVLWAIPKP